VKTATFLLLFANLVFFAWIYFGAGRASDEPQLMEQQLNPQAIRLLRADSLRRSRRANEADGRAPQAAPQGDARPRASSSALSARVTQCACNRLLNLLPSGRDSRSAVWKRSRATGYSFPPQRNRQAQTRKAAELKKFAVGRFPILCRRFQVPICDFSGRV